MSTVKIPLLVTLNPSPLLTEVSLEGLKSTQSESHSELSTNVISPARSLARPAMHRKFARLHGAQKVKKSDTKPNYYDPEFSANV